MLKLSTLAVEDTAAIHLKGPTGELLYGDAARTKPVRIIVFGPGSPAFDALESRQSARTVKRLKANDGEIVAISAEDRRRDTAEDLATITSAFENIEADDPSLTGYELFKAVYADPKLGFIAKQIAKFIGDWGNFTGK